MTYDALMAAEYRTGRRLKAVDVDRWMSVARPYLPSADGLVLDIGAGTGRFTAALAQACGAAVIACEPSAAMRSAWSVHHPQVTLVAGNAEALPFRDNAFDAVWASQVVHHVGDLPAFAANLRRVLRPSGHLLLRGGFGPADRLPLFGYFPDAWKPGAAVSLALPAIAEVLACHRVALVDRVPVTQVFASTAAELVGKVRTRSLSNLAALTDDLFEEGCSALERDATIGAITFPVVEHLDLVAFRSD
ncbi:class I SAM-dependent methyltransferase [Asanoa sp. NPDC050611]|uniref:class I SAM-dependent methyltransferase n=1 Tax=Asanoa sp. NPDC050611 TaxID=3157098 RepID=UPI0033EFAB45